MLFSGLQKAFDRDWNEGRINYSGWQANASDDGVMAFKLLAQTGEKESVNHSIVSTFIPLLISFCKMLKNKYYHLKGLAKRFHLNGSDQTIFSTYSKVRITYKTNSNM